jgi:DNA-binding response OmpR family regulator
MPQTILIVDDEEDVRAAWQKALRNAGYHVLIAGTADRALELCDEHAFDAVVLDFIMPSVDGVQLLVKIRKRLPFVRSLIVSGKLDNDISSAKLSQELKAEIEADLYLHKPLSNDDLRSALDGLLKEQSSLDWRAIAQQAAKAKKVTAKKAAKASKSLKGRRRKN